MSEDVKTPEEYFLQHNFGTESDAGLTEAEQIFLRKYAGLGAGPVVQVREPDTVMAPAPTVPSSVSASIARAVPVAPQSETPEPSPAPAPVESENAPTPEIRTPPQVAASVQDQLKSAEETQLVSFFLSGQEYALPISMVQEVITFVEPTKLPAAPRFIAGIINLRGRVTPLVRLSEMLHLSSRPDDQDRFIVVCRHEGLQIGLIIHAVATMYRVRGEDVEWNIEARLGVGSHHLAGLLKFQEKLIGIIAVDQLVRTVLER